MNLLLQYLYFVQIMIPAVVWPNTKAAVYQRERGRLFYLIIALFMPFIYKLKEIPLCAFLVRPG